jgi:hypothetical protein
MIELRLLGKIGCGTVQWRSCPLGSGRVCRGGAHWMLATAATITLLSAICAGAAQAPGEAEVRLDRDMCGYNSVMLVLDYLEMSLDASKIRALLPAEQAPFTFAQLERCARLCGCRTYLVHYTDRERATFRCPAILHVRANINSLVPDHFVVGFGETRDGLVAADFPGEPVIVPKSRLMQYWEGDALFIEAESGTAIAQMQSVRNRWIGSIFATVALAVLCLYGLTRSKRDAAARLCHHEVHPGTATA